MTARKDISASTLAY